MRESSTQPRIWAAAAGLAGVILFRLNTGKAWVGSGKPQQLSDGSVVIPGARPIALGFSLMNRDPVVGAADLIGWRSITVTPDMVGTTVAVFTSVECKATDGRPTQDQRRWRDSIIAAGGIALVANNPAEAVSKIDAWHPLRR